MSTNSLPPSEPVPIEEPEGAASPLPVTDAAAEPPAEPAESTAPAESAAPADATATEVAPAAEAAPAPRAAAVNPQEVAQKLKQLFPALFAGAPKPFKLRIQQDIQERAPGQFTKQDLSAFFRRHTRSTSYLHALARAKQRVDLDGQAAGEISDEHRQGALAELEQRRAGQDARRQAEDQQRQLEDQQRRNRAGLLRDFETTTLTRANFCALKGVAVDELDGLLEIARRERAERPPERYFDDRRPPGRPQDRPHDRPHDRLRGPGGAPQQRPGQRPDQRTDANRGRPPQGQRRGGAGGGGAGDRPRDGGRPPQPGPRGPRPPRGTGGSGTE